MSPVENPYVHRDFLLSRIHLGYYPYKNLRVKPPTPEVRYEANLEYQKTLEKMNLQLAHTETEVLQLLVDWGEWTNKEQKELDESEKNIEDLKVRLLDLRFNSEARNATMKLIDKAVARQSELYTKRHRLDCYTPEGYAKVAQLRYQIKHSTFLSNGDKYNFDDNISLEVVMNNYLHDLISEKDVRDIAKNEPWATDWSIYKKVGHPFSLPLTRDQRNLTVWSIMYDSVRESHEAPDSEIIQNDYMLDGWLIQQRRKSEGKMSEPVKNKKIQNAQEIFIPASSQEDIEKVDMLNSIGAKRAKRQRLEQAEKEGTVEHHNFYDVRKDLKMQFNRMDR